MDIDWFENDIHPRHSIHKAHFNSIECIDFNPIKNHILASGCHDKTVKLWDVNTLKSTRQLEGHDGGVWTIKFGNDGNMLFSGSTDKNIQVWDIRTGGIVETLKGHQNNVYCMIINPDGTKLLSGDKDGKIYIWNLATMTCEKNFKASSGIIYSLEYIAENQIICSDDESCITIFDATSQKQIARNITKIPDKGVRIQGLAILPKVGDKYRIASAYRDKHLRMWSINSKTMNFQMTDKFLAHMDAITCLTYQDKLLASGGRDGSGRIWDTTAIDKKKRLVGSLMGHKENITSMTFQPTPTDKQVLATCSWDETINFYHL